MGIATLPGLFSTCACLALILANQEDNDTQGTGMKHADKGSATERDAKTAANSRVTWDSPKLQEIERLWQQAKLPPDTPLRHQANKSLVQLTDILRTHLSEKERHELVDSFDTMPDPYGRKGGTAFQYWMPRAIVILLLEAKDREGVVTLLSKQFCRDVAVNYDIESELVSERYKIKDSILILGEAYSKCKVPAMREDIARTVRHAFAGLGLQGANDDEFVKNAMQWYEQNKDQLVVNQGYIACPSLLFRKDTPLFEKKPQADIPPSKTTPKP